MLQYVTEKILNNNGIQFEHSIVDIWRIILIIYDGKHF